MTSTTNHHMTALVGLCVYVMYGVKVCRVMATSRFIVLCLCASARAAFPFGPRGGDPPEEASGEVSEECPEMCCQAMMPSCLACQLCVNIEDFCEKVPLAFGCMFYRPDGGPSFYETLPSFYNESSITYDGSKEQADYIDFTVPDK